MTLQAAPAYIADPTFDHPAELDRNILEGLFQRSGVLRYGDLDIQPIAGLNVTMAAGRMFLLGTASNLQGGYFVWNDAIETIPWPGPSASPRIDSLIIRVRDSQYGTLSGAQGCDWDVATGTPAGSPVALADSVFNSGGAQYDPGAWYRLANIRINVGDTTVNPANITRFQRYVRQPGGITLCTFADRPSDPVLGDRIYEVDTKFTYVHNGTKWLRQQTTIDKTGDESRTSTTTFANITDIQMTNLEANSRYVFSFDLLVLGIVGNDAKFDMSLPAGATIRWSAGPSTPAAATNPVGDVYMGSSDLAAPGWVVGTVDGQNLAARFWGVINTAGTAGTAAMRFAQNVSGASGSWVLRGSTLRYEQVG